MMKCFNTLLIIPLGFSQLMVTQHGSERVIIVRLLFNDSYSWYFYSSKSFLGVLVKVLAGCCIKSYQKRLIYDERGITLVITAVCHRSQQPLGPGALCSTLLAGCGEIFLHKTSEHKIISAKQGRLFRMVP